MQFELSKEYINEVKACLNDNLDATLLQEINQLHPADIAEIINELEDFESKSLFSTLEDEVATLVLVELDEDDRESLLETMNASQDLLSVTLD